MPEDMTKAQFLWGLREQETGGIKDRYSIVNSIGAVGAYQVLKSNVPSWTKMTFGKSYTWQKFRDSPAIQDAVAQKILGGYFDKYGPRGAAAMWYSGQSDPNKTYGNPPVKTYVSSVMVKSWSAPKGVTLPLSGSNAEGTDGGTGGSSGVEQAGLLDLPGDIIDFFKDATEAIGNTIDFFTLLFQPSTYVRISSFFFGLFMLVLAFVFLYKETR